LERIINKRIDAASIGFNAMMKKDMDHTKVQGRYFDQAIPKDLVEYGMIPEFVGRFPVITTTKGLDLDNLVDILTKPKNSIMKQYRKLFAMDDLYFHITKDALLEIAKTAYSRGTGARGLRSITDNVLMDTQYIVPSHPYNIHTVYVCGAAVRNEFPVILFYDPKMTVPIYESYINAGRSYASIDGTIPVNVNDFEETLLSIKNSNNNDINNNAIHHMMTVPPNDVSPLDEVAA
jgi:ATP-dependent protease Clp ATPase subunit